MGRNSKIEWTDHTFNPWRGCSKVSAGCANCYAERQSKRNPDVLGVWGDAGTRVVASDAYWKQPIRWDREAKGAGVRSRVFCASLADVFEDRPELVAPRERLWKLIDETPNLDWLLLTKRPENLRRLLPAATWPNVWLGVSAEDQATADERIPKLLKTPAAVRFVSAEPLLGPVDMSRWMFSPDGFSCSGESGDPVHREDGGVGLDWVIVGGESGPGARPMHPDWARSLRDQCQDAGVPFFFKQWGAWVPDSYQDWQEDQRVWLGDLSMWRHGHIAKKYCPWRYRTLDGRTWEEVPRG